MGAKIYNSNLTKEIIDGAKLQITEGSIPSELAEKVIPVMEVNPKLLKVCNIVKSGVATNATSGIVYTTPTDKDFYLVSASASFVKDATATSTYTALFVQPEGASATDAILYFRTLTLTAERGSESISFNNPIKIKKGTNITIANSNNVANISVAGCIIGYTVDNITA